MLALTDHAPVRIGIYRYARPQRLWEFQNCAPADVVTRWRELSYQWDGQKAQRPRGMICQSPYVAKRCSQWPVVCLHGGRLHGPIYQVGCDDHAIGVMAAEHLMSLGLRHFAYIGIRAHGFCSSNQWFAFRRRLREADHTFTADRFRWYGQYPPVRKSLPFGTIFREEIHRWVEQLPRPVGVFCEDDLRGMWVCEACRRLGIPVPEQVAVLGTGDSEINCNESWPALSSIRLPEEKIGYEAARMLDNLIRHRRTKRVVLLPPLGVAARRSTDALAVRDPEVAAALAFIRRHACEGIQVEDVVQSAAISRRVLENRFREILGRTPFREIRHQQIRRAREWLVDTDASIDKIAQRTGFASRVRLSEEFRKAVGMSPGAYRMQFRIH